MGISKKKLINWMQVNWRDDIIGGESYINYNDLTRAIVSGILDEPDLKKTPKNYRAPVRFSRTTKTKKKVK
jgi:hypothetical protein